MYSFVEPTPAQTSSKLNDEEKPNFLNLNFPFEERLDLVGEEIPDARSPKIAEPIVVSSPSPVFEISSPDNEIPFPVREEPDGSEGDTENEITPVPLSSSFDDFCDFRSVLPPDKFIESSSVIHSEPAPAFETDFVATFPDVEVESQAFPTQTTIQTSKSDVIVIAKDEEEDDDDFGDFSEAPLPTFQKQTSVEADEILELPPVDLSKFGEILEEMFQREAGNDCTVEAVLPVGRDFNASEMLKQMKDIETSHALRYKYPNSSSSIALMDSIGIDSKNAVSISSINP